jgi:hypothetical protein
MELNITLWPELYDIYSIQLQQIYDMMDLEVEVASQEAGSSSLNNNNDARDMAVCPLIAS